MKLREFITSMNEELEKVYNEHGNIEVATKTMFGLGINSLNNVTDIYELGSAIANSSAILLFEEI